MAQLLSENHLTRVKEERGYLMSFDILTPLSDGSIARQSSIRSLSTIAADIRRHWPKVYFGAVPYLNAMASLNSITDSYYYDSAESVVLYFLSNATTWRGDDARRIKTELKAMLPKRR